jgi:hypothetical protein
VSDDDVPFEDLARRVRERRERAAEADDPFADLPPTSTGDPDDDAFEWVEVDPVDGAQVWARLERESEPTEAPPLPDVPPSETDGDATATRVVPKASYCERCRFLSDPPEIACEHEGTSIVGVPDREHFEVRNCPVVAAAESEGLDPVSGDERAPTSDGD